MSERNLLTREFSLELFDRSVLAITDVAELQNMCIRLRAQLHSQELVYESLLREVLES